jgi:chemotaxis family two-component system response regulator Rcp1
MYYSRKSTSILLVEDNPAEIRLFLEVIGMSSVLHKINIVTDGEMAISFLRKRGEHLDAETPALIILDLNIPKKNGGEVIAEIKADPFLNYIPIVVFSSSDNEDEIRNVYSLNANCYIKKPNDYYDFVKAVRSIEDFWIDKAILPPKAI